MALHPSVIGVVGQVCGAIQDISRIFFMFAIDEKES
jgi:hypothetical protein